MTHTSLCRVYSRTCPVLVCAVSRVPRGPTTLGVSDVIYLGLPHRDTLTREKWTDETGGGVVGVRNPSGLG